MQWALARVAGPLTDSLVAVQIGDEGLRRLVASEVDEGSGNVLGPDSGQPPVEAPDAVGPEGKTSHRHD